jgi:hypothetical protein
MSISNAPLSQPAMGAFSFSESGGVGGDIAVAGQQSPGGRSGRPKGSQFWFGRWAFRVPTSFRDSASRPRSSLPAPGIAYQAAAGASYLLTVRPGFSGHVTEGLKLCFRMPYSARSANDPSRRRIGIAVGNVQVVRES